MPKKQKNNGKTVINKQLKIVANIVMLELTQKNKKKNNDKPGLKNTVLIILVKPKK